MWDLKLSAPGPSTQQGRRAATATLTFCVLIGLCVAVMSISRSLPAGIDPYSWVNFFAIGRCVATGAIAGAFTASLLMPVTVWLVTGKLIDPRQMIAFSVPVCAMFAGAYIVIGSVAAMVLLTTKIVFFMLLP